MEHFLKDSIEFTDEEGESPQSIMLKTSFYKIKFIAVKSKIMDNEKDLGYSVECKNRILCITPNEYEIMKMEINRNGCCFACIPNVKTQNDIIVNHNINEKEMHLHTISPVDSNITCIVKVNKL
jgi:hypothetical protein